MRKLTSIIALLLVFVTLLSACGSAPEKKADPSAQQQGSETAAENDKTPAAENDKTPAAESGKDTLVVASLGDCEDLDPQGAASQQTWRIKMQVYEPIVQMDGNNNLMPCLAESWEWEDDLTLVFHLRKGVKFHDGTELKASDVLSTYKRCKEMPTAQIATEMLDIENSEVVDDYTLRLKLLSPWPQIVNYLAYESAGICSEKSYNESNGDFTSAPIGTGPYKVKDWVPGDRIELVANEDYWEEGKPYIKNVTIRIIAEESTRLVELESGGVDIAYDISPSAIEQVEANPNLQLVRSLSANTRFVGLNAHSEPLKDLRVRQALRYAVDWAGVANASFNGHGVAAEGFFTNTVEGFASDLNMLDRYPYDVEKAKELMAEAGYPDGGLKLKLVTAANYSPNVIAAEVLQEYWKEIGVELEIETGNNAAVQGTLTGGTEGWDMCIYGITCSTGDADRGLRPFYSTSISSTNVTRYNNPEVDALLDQAILTNDKDAQKEIYHQVQEILVEDLPWLPIAYKEQITGCAGYIGGFENGHFEAHLLKNVYFAD